jgi:hypothetical protein
MTVQEDKGCRAKGRSNRAASAYGTPLGYTIA